MVSMMIQRKILGLTLFEMAQQIGCSQSHLSNIETGKTKLYDAGFIRNIAKHYKLDFSAVFAEMSPGGAMQYENNKSGVRNAPGVPGKRAANEPVKSRAGLRKVAG